ncbi:MAG: transglutaminase-like domain-containing protein [Anaerolineales bacterium]
MIEVLGARIKAWLPEREFILPGLIFIFEIGVVLTFLFGLDQAVTGFVAVPYLLPAFWGILLPRAYSLSKGAKVGKSIFLVVSGLLGVVISTLRIWNLVGWLVANYSVAGAYLPQAALLRISDQMQIYSGMVQHFSVLQNNLTIWYQYISRGNAIQVSQITQLIWGTVIFLGLAWLGWQLHLRRKPFLAVIVPVVVLGIASEFSNDPLQYFGFLFVFSVSIVVVFSHAERERNWIANGYGFSLEIRPDLWGATAMVCLIAFLISLFPPRLSLRTLLEKMDLIGNQEQTEVDLASGLGLSQLYPDPSDSESTGSLPSSHLISNPPEELDTHLFDIWVGEETPVFSANWRTHTYQTYTGHGWLSGSVFPRRYATEEVLQPDQGILQVREVFTVWARSPVVEGKLIHAYQLVRVDQPVDVLWRDVDTTRGDYSMGVVGVPLYTVEVSRPVNSVDWMQASGFDYPDWVKQRYLQLPADLPDEVRVLGESFATQYQDPFSRARAIESFLREFPYTLDVPTPPADKDVVGYFLFDLQEGYCDYFATAMAVLARSAGLPARVVGGYATGTYQEEEHLFTVTAAEAHTWVEVYFVGIGWVEFEPTPARPLHEYLVRVKDAETPEEDEALPTPVLPTWRQVLIWTSVALFSPLFVWFTWDRIRFLRLSKLALLTRARDRLYHIAGQLGIGDSHCLTPGENRLLIVDRLETRFVRRSPRFLLRNAGTAVTDLVSKVEDSAFRGVPVDDVDKKLLVQTLRRAVRVSRRLSLIEFFQR